MGRCTVCNHESVLKIDAWIVQGVSSGEIVRRVGDLSRSAVHRHRVNGMHLGWATERLAAEVDAGKHRAANRKVREGLKAQQRALEAQQAQQAQPAYEPPPGPPPAPAEPQPINPPNKVFDEDEVRSIMYRVRRNKQRPLKLPTYSFEEPRRVTYPAWD